MFPVDWRFPLSEFSGLPVGDHPGAFGAKRKYDIHTGVDLYTVDGAKVFAVESGIVKHIGRFTGKSIGTGWWNETDAIVIEGASGCVVYGEITVGDLAIGDRVSIGDCLGVVTAVLPDHKKRTDIVGHSTSMLHLELLREFNGEFVDWGLGEVKPFMLLDPTPMLAGIGVNFLD